MPRKPQNTDIDPENIYNSLPNSEEVQEFLDNYTNQGLDSYREAYTSDYDFDYDNYGFSDYWESKSHQQQMPN